MDLRQLIDQAVEKLTDEGFEVSLFRVDRSATEVLTRRDGWRAFDPGDEAQIVIELVKDGE